MVNCVNALPQLLRNDASIERNFVKIRLVGMKANRTGIGARITVTARTLPGAAQPLRQIEEVRSGGSYYSQNDLRLHFGLDQARVVDRVEITWPSGTKDVLRELPANKLYVIQEGGKVLSTLAMTGTSRKSR